MQGERNTESSECAWLNIPGESPWQQNRELSGGMLTYVEMAGLQ
jgi:hypothetical protein